MVWRRQAGSAAAKQFLADYPTPRALRQAVRERNIRDIVPDEVKARLITRDNTRHPLGYYLDHDGGLDLALIHRLVSEQAGDVEVWTAPDGTQTIRPL